MAKQFLDLTGLATFLTQLNGFFATKNAVQEVKTSTDPYIFEIDYENNLAFDTSLIVSGGSTSSLLDVGLLDMMILE